MPPTSHELLKAAVGPTLPSRDSVTVMAVTVTTWCSVVALKPPHSQSSGGSAANTKHGSYQAAPASHTATRHRLQGDCSSVWRL